MSEIAATPDVRQSGWRDSLRYGPGAVLGVMLVLAGVAVSPPIGAAIVVFWVWLSRTPWRDIGYVRPKSWIGAILIGIAFGVALKLLMKALVMPLLGAPPVNPVFGYMTNNPTAFAEFAVYAIVGAGWGEETVFRGWLFERLGKLFGSNAAAKALIVVLTAALFGAAHWQQGLPGMEQAAIIGLLVGTLFAITGRLVWLMITHAAFDLTAAAIIFFGAETQISHLVFK